MKLRFSRSVSLLAAILLVHLLFFLVALIHPTDQLTDSMEYRQASRNLYTKGIVYCGDLSEPVTEEQYTRRPPLYPLLLGAGILAGSNIPVYLIQILISMLSILLVHRIFLHQAAPPLIFALVMLLATPAQFIYANLIMAEIPFQLCLVVMTWSVFQYFRREDSRSGHESSGRDRRDQGPGDRYIWLFNISLVLGMATKPVLFPFAVLMILLSTLLFAIRRNRTFLLAMVLPLLWISAYGVRNHQRTGSVQYSSIQTANLVNYNLRYFIMGQQGADVASEEVDRLYSVCGDTPGYREKNSCLNREARKIILDQPFRYSLFHLKGSIRYFLDPGRFDLATFFRLPETGSRGMLETLNSDGVAGAFRLMKQQGWGWMALLLCIGLFKLLKVSGFVLYLFRRNESFPLRIFLLALVGYMALVTGPLGASRFLLPVELLIIGAAVQGWALKLKDTENLRKVR